MYQVLAYIKYWLNSVDEHSLQSPFLFDFYQNVVKRSGTDTIDEIECLRHELLHDKHLLEIEDLGAGSRVSKSNSRQVKQIAKHASTPAKFSNLLYRLIRHSKCQNILELGTSLGLNTLYMAKANKDASLYTFEGSDLIADYAIKHFERFQCNNITMVRRNIDDSLPTFLQNDILLDLVYMDANHRFEPTIRYFDLILPRLNDKSIVVIDDIHWSREMKQAWNQIKSRPEISISIDLFEAGLLFLIPKGEQIPKSDWVINF